MNVRVDLRTPIYDGMEVVFKAPCGASEVTGLIVYYPGDSGVASSVFSFADAHTNDLGDLDELFAEGAVVKVILDTETNMAFVQNAATNAYLEKRFREIKGGGTTSCYMIQAIWDCTDDSYGLVEDLNWDEVVDAHGRGIPIICRVTDEASQEEGLTKTTDYLLSEFDTEENFVKFCKFDYGLFKSLTIWEDGSVEVHERRYFDTSEVQKAINAAAPTVVSFTACRIQTKDDDIFGFETDYDLDELLALVKSGRIVIGVFNDSEDPSSDFTTVATYIGGTSSSYGGDAILFTAGSSHYWYDTYWCRINTDGMQFVIGE